MPPVLHSITLPGSVKHSERREQPRDSTHAKRERREILKEREYTKTEHY